MAGTSWVISSPQSDGGTLPPFVVEASGLMRQTRADLISDLAHENGTLAFVFGDDDAFNNGIWLKYDIPGFGGWNLVFSMSLLLRTGQTLNVLASLTTSEAISAGALVNVFQDGVSGNAMLRNANATDNTKPADGFVSDDFSMGEIATFSLPGQVDIKLASLSPGLRYYLSTTPGAITITPPSATGNVVQEVGVAVAVNALSFQPKQAIML